MRRGQWQRHIPRGCRPPWRPAIRIRSARACQSAVATSLDCIVLKGSVPSYRRQHIEQHAGASIGTCTLRSGWHVGRFRKNQVANLQSDASKSQARHQMTVGTLASRAKRRSPGLPGLARNAALVVCGYVAVYVALNWVSSFQALPGIGFTPWPERRVSVA